MGLNELLFRGNNLCVRPSLMYTNDHYFGRNFDYEISYNEVVTVTPRNYKLVFRKVNNLDKHYAMIGIAAGIS